MNKFLVFFLLFASLSLASVMTTNASTSGNYFGIGSAQTVLRMNNGTWLFVWIDSSGYFNVNYTNEPNSSSWSTRNISNILGWGASPRFVRSVVANSNNQVYFLLSNPIGSTSLVNTTNLNTFTIQTSIASM